MNLEKIKAELKRSVAFDLKQALITIGKYIIPSSPKFDSYILLLGRFNQCISEYNKNLISNVDKNLIFDKTRDIALQFIDELIIEDLIFIESKQNQEEEIQSLQKKLNECENEIRSLKNSLGKLTSCQFTVSYIGVEVIENIDSDSNIKYPLIVRELYETDLQYPEKLFLIELNPNYPENIVLNSYLKKESKIIFTREYLSIKNEFCFRRLIFLKSNGNYSNIINISINISEYDILKKWSKTTIIDSFRDNDKTTIIDDDFFTIIG